MTKTKKTHTIIFRVADDEWQQVGSAAAAAGQGINDWSRQVTIAHASQPSALSPSERLLYEELARTRYLLGHGFGLLASNQLTVPSWEKIKIVADQKPAEIADALLARRQEKGKTA
jgi:uncharacterized protein (DUF1778 family)